MVGYFVDKAVDVVEKGVAAPHRVENDDISNLAEMHASCGQLESRRMMYQARDELNPAKLEVPLGLALVQHRELR